MFWAALPIGVCMGSLHADPGRTGGAAGFPFAPLQGVMPASGDSAQ